MNDPFEGKICVVTGAASGIGRALALALSARGAALAISDIDAAGLEETRARLAPSNRVRTDVFDIADAAAIEAYAPRVRESLGPADYLFNVAGLTRIGAFKATPLSSFEKIVDVNYWGVVRMTKAFLPQLLETKGGLINISSVFGVIAVPGQTHYCSTKFAVRGFSEALELELRDDGVRVTTVHPGGIKTAIARNAEVDALPDGSASRKELSDVFDDKIAITTSESAAETILKGAARGKRRVMIGRDARVVSFVQRLFPSGYPKFVALLGGNSWR